MIITADRSRHIQDKFRINIVATPVPQGNTDQDIAFHRCVRVYMTRVDARHGKIKHGAQRKRKLS